MDSSKNVTLAVIIAVVVVGLALAGANAYRDKSTSKIVEKSVVNGTTTERTTVNETSTDADGDRTTESRTTTTVDPEGLMNKKTIEDERTTQEQQTP